MRKQESRPDLMPYKLSAILVIVAVFGLSGCEGPSGKNASPQEVSSGEAPANALMAAPTALPSVETPETVSVSGAPAVAEVTGILAKRTKPPKGGPNWLAVQAEVIEREGKRILRTSHFVRHIKNPSLAQQTAANRARQELTKWLGSPTLRGAMLTDQHWDPKKQLSAARIEIELPESWTPHPTATEEDETEP